MERAISVVSCESYKPAYFCIKLNDLDSIHTFVGGYLETVALEDGCILCCNEEGKILDLPDNRIVPSVGMIKGNFFICALDEDGEFKSLSPEQRAKYLELLK